MLLQCKELASRLSVVAPEVWSLLVIIHLSVDTRLSQDGGSVWHCASALMKGMNNMAVLKQSLCSQQCRGSGACIRLWPILTFASSQLGIDNAMAWCSIMIVRGCQVAILPTLEFRVMLQICWVGGYCISRRSYTPFLWQTTLS